jgi:3-phosphoshikimate 1-carboxyvinyltransferase
LLAGLSARGETVLSGEIRSRDHTERLLTLFGVKLEIVSELEFIKEIRMVGGQGLKAARVDVPGDLSAAAFWIAASCLVSGDACIEVDGINLNPTRMGFIHVLQRMGASIDIRMISEFPEPVGHVRVSSRGLVGATVMGQEIPSLIDELPLLAVLGSQAHGVTEVRDAEELRAKETDRIEALAQGLRSMGVFIEVRKDGFLIEGPQKLRGASVQSFHDHRIAMALSIAALIADGETRIQDADCVSISYPEFYSTLRELTQ